MSRASEYAVWRHDQMLSMSEEDYWRYLHDEAYRAGTERRWREQWLAMQQGVPSP